jgi:hypothetical protein
MKSKDITVVIRTIGRDSLLYAIESAKKEFKNVIVVADRFDLNVSLLPDQIVYLKNNLKVDEYGGACINLAAKNCNTKYLCLLDDDDEFVVGAGKYMQRKIATSPDIDIWIPGIVYNDGYVTCMEKDFKIGNVAVPTYKVSLFDKIPFNESLGAVDPSCTDFYHVLELANIGAKVDWYQKELYNVRPRLNGKHGRGT